MLAYATVTNFIHLPSAFEATVYMAGFVVVLTLPTIVFDIIDSKANKLSSGHKPKRQGF